MVHINTQSGQVRRKSFRTKKSQKVVAGGGAGWVKGKSSMCNGDGEYNYNCAKLRRELGCEGEVGGAKVKDTVKMDYKDVYCMSIVC
jgi:hypothetical protein